MNQRVDIPDYETPDVDIGDIIALSPLTGDEGMFTIFLRGGQSLLDYGAANRREMEAALRADSQEERGLSDICGYLYPTHVLVGVFFSGRNRPVLFLDGGVRLPLVLESPHVSLTKLILWETLGEDALEAFGLIVARSASPKVGERLVRTPAVPLGMSVWFAGFSVDVPCPKGRNEVSCASLEATFRAFHTNLLEEWGGTE